jgi:aryl-alcohol dehydrogenase-like predicted oxidoreductase
MDLSGAYGHRDPSGPRKASESPNGATLVGATKPAQIAQSVAAIELADALTGDQLTELRALTSP